MANSWESLIDSWDPVIRRAFLDSFYQVRNTAQIDQIARMLERGDVDGALRAVGLRPESFRPLDRALERAFEAGGDAVARSIPPSIKSDGARLIVQFNIRNPSAERWLRDHSSTLIRDILDDQRVMVRSHLEAGMAQGLNPRTAALDLVGRISAETGRREGGVIGLTNSQAEWVRRYEAELASDRPLEALKRTLRDKRFDAAVRKAADTGEPIPAALRAKMVTAYRNRALRYRANAIARTEAMASLHQAQEEAMRQAIDSGAVSADALTYVWRTARDKRVRDSHAAMDGQEVRQGERFRSGAGNLLRYPGDPQAPAEDVINCRCWRETKVDFLAGVE
jgi:hypothetical protein